MSNLTEPPPLLNLPPDINFDILSRLSVKTLAKFRCVSKSWQSLISNPLFIKKHLHISTNDENYTNYRVIMNCKDPDFNFKSCSIYSIFNEPSSVDAIEHDHPRKHPNRRDHIVGSCNGLVCVNMNKDIICIWNPSSRESRRIPHCGFKLRKKSYVIYGFGYDGSSNDYKVVAIFHHSLGYQSYHKDKEMKVYSLKTNSWRDIEPYPYGVPRPTDIGLFVDDGALIWPAIGGYLDPVIPHRVHLSWHIIAFDLAKETYQELPQPAYGDGSYDQFLGVLGGCLCLMDNYRGTRADLWVMKEYGVGESWTKAITVPYVVNLWNSGFFPYYKALWFLKNGEVLVDIKNQLVLYSDVDNTFSSPVIHNFHSCLASIVYVESLVSPNAHEWMAALIVEG